MVSAIQAKFQDARKALQAALIERDDEVDMVLTALIAQEHCLLVGPPGTAKSLLLDSLAQWTAGKRFSVLTTKFSTPEEFFGPVSVAGLKADVYRRITTGKLPEAEFAFLDEVFKGSSAILNTVLRIMNERTFENGDGTFRKVPLKQLVAASNEFPHDQEGGKELGALFDRFLFRRKVKPIVSQEGRRRLLWERDHSPKFTTSITPAEIDQAHAEAMALPWTADAKDALESILRELAKEGIQPGDRRQYKSVAACQAFAYLAGAAEVKPEHLEVLAHTLWDDPQEQPEKTAQVVAKIANPVGLRVTELMHEANEILGACDVKNLAQAAAATAKLGDVAKRLKAMTNGNGRVTKALNYVTAKVKEIRLASLESI